MIAEFHPRGMDHEALSHVYPLAQLRVHTVSFEHRQRLAVGLDTLYSKLEVLIIYSHQPSPHLRQGQRGRPPRFSEGEL